MPSFPRSHSYSQPNSPIEHDRVLTGTSSSGADTESHSDKLSALPDLLLKVAPSLNSSPRLRNNQILHPHSHSYSHSQSQSSSQQGHAGHGLFGTSNSEPELPHTRPHTPNPNHSPRQNLARLSIDSGGSLPSFQRVMHTSNTAPRKGTPGEDKSRSRSQSFSRAASPLRIIQQWAAHHVKGHVEDEEEVFVPVNPFKWRNRFLGLVPVPNDIEAQKLAEPQEEQQGQEQEQEKGKGSPQTTCNRSFLASLLSLVHIGTSKQPTSPHSHSSFSSSSTGSRIFGPETRLYLTNILPRQIYLHLHLRLPALYFSRVARIFEDAEVSKPEVQRIIDTRQQFKKEDQTNNSGGPAGKASTNTNMNANANGGGVAAAIGSATRTGIAGLSGGLSDDEEFALPYPELWIPPHVSPALARFKLSWEAFIDALVKEWKTFNVVSALLLSAIMTMFQVPQAAEDTVTRTAAFLSLICALMSLSYGCVYIVRFGTMRSMVRASRWAEEARKSHTAILWNVWIMLALPAAWLAWSMVAFIVSILSLVWRTDWHAQPDDSKTPSEPSSMVSSDWLLPRILITTVFVLGLVYFGLIVKTLAGYSYGAGNGAAKRRWQKIVHSMSNDGVHEHVHHLDENRGRRRHESGGRKEGGSHRHREREREVRKQEISESSKSTGLLL